MESGRRRRGRGKGKGKGKGVKMGSGGGNSGCKEKILVEKGGTVPEICAELKEHYATRNTPRVHQLKSELYKLEQGKLTLVEYYTKLKTIWDELASYSRVASCTCGAMKDMLREEEEEKVYQFLMGLDGFYDELKSNILMEEPIPSLSETYRIIRREEEKNKREEEKNNKKGSWLILVEKGGTGYGSDFCIVDLRTNECNMVGGVLWNREGVFGGLTAVENKIYAIGGAYEDPEKVNLETYPKHLNIENYSPEGYHVHSGSSVLDLTSSPCEWKDLRGGRMIDPVDRLPGLNKAVSIGDTIFYFTKDLCLFYDTSLPRKNRWRPLPGLPLVQYPVVVTDPLNDRFLCHFPKNDSLYACYPHKQDNPSWVRLQDDVPRFYKKFFPTVVDGVIYSYWGEDDYDGYDIHTNQILKISWSCSSHSSFAPSDVFDYTFASLIYLGDDVLCLPAYIFNVGAPVTLVFFRILVTRTSDVTATFTPLTVHRISNHGFHRPSNFLPL